MFTQPEFAKNFPGMTIGQSQRTGGVSLFPKNALNLGLYTDDSLENIMENRRRFVSHVGWQLEQFAGAHQVHGADIKRVDTPGEYQGYDALITNRPGILLTITTADCVPVLLYDPVNEACGAAHAGWKGTVAAIATKTLDAMQRHFGTSPIDCYVYLGVGIQASHFEVRQDVARFFTGDHLRPAPVAGKYFVDLSGTILTQLTEAGVSLNRIEQASEGTVSNNDRYFSYRAEGGKTGRMLSIIGRKI